MAWTSTATYEQLELLVALKLEEASDVEIANCLNIKVVEIPKMLSLLAKTQNLPPKQSYPNQSQSQSPTASASLVG